MGLAHGGVVWSDGTSTVLADLGVQGYAGGVLPEAQSILRVTAGAATRVGAGWTASLETVLESDVHHEGTADGTDVVPAVTAGLRRAGRWDLGLGVSRAWTFPAAGQGEAEVAFLVDLARRY
jgi:hypothetical protein